MLEELRIALGVASGILVLYALTVSAARRVKKPRLNFMCDEHVEGR